MWGHVSNVSERVASARWKRAATYFNEMFPFPLAGFAMNSDSLPMPTPLLNSLPERRKDRQTRDAIYDLTASAVCPICRGPLIARYHPARGPYFHCHCENSHP